MNAKAKASGKLRYALIGSGGIGKSHLRALSDFREEEVEFVAAADPHEKALNDTAEQFDIDRNHLYTDYEQLLEKVKPDAVSVCTPNGLHAPASIAASQAGAHVIVEKPMAMNAEECRQMIDAAQAAGKKLVIGFQYRFDPKTQFLKRAAEEDRLGPIHYARVQALRRRGIPNWGVFGRKELQGGGPLIDIGVHMLEQCHYVMGSPRPVAAVGMTSTYLGDKPSTGIASQWAGWDYKTYTVEDLAVGHIRFEDGSVVHIESSFASHIQDNVMNFQIMGEKGGCAWDPPRLFTDDVGHMVNVEPGWLPQNATHQWRMQAKLRDFLDHVMYDKPTLIPAEDGLMVQQMLDAIYRSAENGGRETTIEELVTTA